MSPSATEYPLLAQLLNAQHGAVSRSQALACGMTDEVIEARLLSCRWQRVHRGVYVAFNGPIPRMSRIWAALLRAGAGAIVSHQTAAELDGVTNESSFGSGASSELIHVSVPVSRRVRSFDRVQIHHVRRLAAKRHPARFPPRTTTEDTVLDLVDDSESIDEVLTWVTRACQRRRTTPERLRTALQARPNVRWAGEAALVLADVEDGAHSVLEVLYRRDVEQAHGLPSGRRQRPPVSGPGRTSMWSTRNTGLGWNSTVASVTWRRVHSGTWTATTPPRWTGWTGCDTGGCTCSGGRA